jgi:hypothetical protein
MYTISEYQCYMTAIACMPVLATRARRKMTTQITYRYSDCGNKLGSFTVNTVPVLGVRASDEADDMHGRGENCMSKCPATAGPR